MMAIVSRKKRIKVRRSLHFVFIEVFLGF